MVSKYKETEIGSMPEEWEVTSLSDAFQNLEAGVSVNSDERQNGDFFVLKTSAISDGLINIDEAKPVVKKEYARLKCPVKKGSIIISRMNTPQLVGACGYVAEDAKGYFLPDRLWQVVNSKPEKYDFRWLNYLLNQYRYKNAIHALATGTSNSMKNISKERLLEIRIPRPSIEEQKLIVEAISDIETLISDLEKLIWKKKDIRQGTMQMLLTGKTRMPGYNGNFVKVSLGELGSLSKTSINPSQEPKTIFEEYSMPAFDAGEKPNQMLGEFMLSSRIRISPDTLLFNKLNVRQRRVWYIRDCDEKAVCSSEFLPYKSDKINLSFLKQLLLTDKVTQDFEDMSSGTSNSQQRITPADFLKYEISIPSLREQEEIAVVIEDMDLEIKKLEAKLSKYQKVKQGMMEELLTGKVRLI
ncbi:MULTISPECIES: restriction endonuclease subunit S [unclassified Bilifractor]|uniref:restriction endonuclease subunit S n=1 Tax=unclassified Bilifractor TaxID=2815795 RepID=UPI003F8FD597